jgi:glycosyltransferase involved in cell wall biosynthesis
MITYDEREPFQKFVTSHDPLVSVIIPSYNKAENLPECVESYINQTYKNIEILIVNDGSPDNTSEVAHSLIAKYPEVNIKLLEKPNGGVSDARNFGYQHCSGRVAMTMDGDDKAKPTYLEKALKAFRETGADIFRPNQQNFGLEDGQWIPHNYDRFFIRYDNCFPTPSVIDKCLFQKTGGFKICLGYAEDWEFWVSCSRFNPKVAQADELLTCYRMNDDGIAATFIDGKWQDCAIVVIMTNEDLYSVQEILGAHDGVPKSAPNNIKRMNELNRIHPRQWFLKFFLGLVAESEGNRDEALSLYKRSIELSGEKNWQPMYRLAMLAHSNGQLAEAQSLYHEVRILRPDMGAVVNPIMKEIGEHFSSGAAGK